MDTITQGLLGAVTAQLGFRQRIGRDATWVAAAAAVMPDLDILLLPFVEAMGSESPRIARLVSHRALSHSLLVVPLVAAVIALVWWWYRHIIIEHNTDQTTPADDGKSDRRTSFAMLYACSFVAIFSHPLLDWCTSYGTQLFSPVTTARYAIDTIAIIDIIYTPILILTLLACYITRKTKTRHPAITMRIGWIGFALSVAYIAAGYGMRHLAIDRARQTMSQIPSRNGPSAEPTEFAAYPQLGSIFVWRVTCRTQTAWTVGRVNLLFGPLVDKSAWNHAEIPDNRWVRRARKLPAVQMFDWFTLRQTRPVYTQHDDLHTVEFHDMRYGTSAESLGSLWSRRVTFSRTGHVIAVEHIHQH